MKLQKPHSLLLQASYICAHSANIFCRKSSDSWVCFLVFKMDLSFKLSLWDLERRKLNHVVENFFNFSLHYLYTAWWALVLEMLCAEAACAEVFAIAGGLSCLLQPLFLPGTPLRHQWIGIVLKWVLGGERAFFHSLDLEEANPLLGVIYCFV